MSTILVKGQPYELTGEFLFALMIFIVIYLGFLNSLARSLIALGNERTYRDGLTVIQAWSWALAQVITFVVTVVLFFHSY